MAMVMEKSGWIRETQEVESAWLVIQLNESWGGDEISMDA